MGDIGFILILLLLFVPMILMMNKNRKMQRQAAEMRASLGIGDEVITGSGFVGTIVDEDDTTLILESDSGVRTKWLRGVVQSRVDPKVPDSPAGLSSEDETGEDEARVSQESPQGTESSSGESDQPRHHQSGEPSYGLPGSDSESEDQDKKRD